MDSITLPVLWEKIQQYRVPIGRWAIGLVYGFGIAGLFSPWRAWFIAMTPASLLLSYGLLAWNHPSWKRRDWLCWSQLFALGYFSEVLGVNTGFPFGDYAYGSVLGLQIWHTPVLIGVNWTIVTYTSNNLARTLWPGGAAWLYVLLGAAAPTALDFLIEPVAIRLGYWQWADGLPPWQNYAGWFGVSLIASLVFQRYYGHKAIQNPMSAYLLVWQWLFFLLPALLTFAG